MAPKRQNKRRPASTDEGREHQMVSLAIDLAEKQLMEGTASAQVITHYLKLGSPREQMERNKLNKETQLLDSRVDAMASQQKTDEMFAEALSAFRGYSGQEAIPEADDFDD